MTPFCDSRRPIPCCLTPRSEQNMIRPEHSTEGMQHLRGSLTTSAFTRTREVGAAVTVLQDGHLHRDGKKGASHDCICMIFVPADADTAAAGRGAGRPHATRPRAEPSRVSRAEHAP